MNLKPFLEVTRRLVQNCIRMPLFGIVQHQHTTWSRDTGVVASTSQPNFSRTMRSIRVISPAVKLHSPSSTISAALGSFCKKKKWKRENACQIWKWCKINEMTAIPTTVVPHTICTISSSIFWSKFLWRFTSGSCEIFAATKKLAAARHCTCFGWTWKDNNTQKKNDRKAPTDQQENSSERFLLRNN